MRVVGYHRAIANATGMPMVLFQLQPMLGGVLYPPEVLDGLPAIPQVVAIGTGFRARGSTRPPQA